MSLDNVFAPWCLLSPLYIPQPSSHLCILLHLWAAYNSAESHSSSFAGVSVLSALALIMLYFTRYICSTFNLLQCSCTQTIIYGWNWR